MTKSPAWVAAAAATACVLGFMSAPAAHAEPEAYNNWYPTEYDLQASDGPAWRVTMDASGKGIVFSGSDYRDYNAATDTWGPWKRLHTDPERLTAKGNARGDVCSAWSADFGAAIACRAAGSTNFIKTNLTASRNATVEELAVSSDGRRALVIWRDTSNNRSRENATVYTLATQQASTTQLQGIPGGTPLRYYPVSARVGRSNGFALAYVTGEEGTRGSATYYRTFRPSQGWSPQRALRLGTPAQPVVLSDFTSDGRRTYAAVTPDIPQNANDYPAVWWITELNTNGAFSSPEVVNTTLDWPVIGSSSTSVHIAGRNPATRDLVIAGSGDFIDAPIEINNIPSPRIGAGEGSVTDIAIVGQRFASGSDGFAVVVQYSGVLNPGGDDDESEDRLYTLVGEDVGGLSTLRRLGNKAGYEGMVPHLAGYGQYALTAYSWGLQIYAGARGPLPS